MKAFLIISNPLKCCSDLQHCAHTAHLCPFPAGWQEVRRRQQHIMWVQWKSCSVRSAICRMQVS
eukprot:scaffold489934_cov24-Prasinocladus_malaysianus.AAC.1